MLFLVLLMVNVSLILANECSKDVECFAGAHCLDGQCQWRPECPIMDPLDSMPEGCRMEMERDHNDCPMPKFVCGKECGAVHCPRGYECDVVSTKCVSRTDCPPISTPPIMEGCTVYEEYDQNDCLSYRSDCEESEARFQRSTDTKTKKPICAKNAEWKECSNICPEKSCENVMQVSSCFSLRCGAPACVCKEGHVLLTSEDKEKGCVPRETCRKLSALEEAKRKTAELRPRRLL